jgi:3-oxoadipate enol-lactonase
MAELRTFYQSSSSDKTLVLIHAFPLSSEMWEETASEIGARSPDFSILLADLPGFGNAPEKKVWTLSEEMSELHSKLLSLGIRKPVIGGLSMGGYAAFAYYKLFPNEVRALVLSNTKPAADSPEAKKGRDEFAVDAEMRGAEAVYDRLLLKLVFSDSSKGKDPTLIPKLKKWIAQFSPTAIAAGLRALKAREDSSELLEKISCPTLVIVGVEDVIIPAEEMKTFSAKIHDARYVPMDRVGHLSAVESPEGWGEIVSAFLNEL